MVFGLGDIRVGIIGVGNIASMLVQSVEYYKAIDSNEGLIHEVIGGYDIRDLRFVYAVDVSSEKVGRDLSEAILAYPNMVRKFVDIPRLGVTVRMGRILDGVAPHMVDDFKPAKLPEPSENELVREVLDAGVDVLVNLLPVGSEDATRFYARVAARAGVAFVNAIPVFIASSPTDSIVELALENRARMRGAKLVETYQLNIGGNTDFKNMLALERLKTKKESKTLAVASTQDEPEVLLREERVYAGPSGYIPFLGNTKISHMYMRIKAFAGSDVEIEVKLKVDDKAMATAVLVDVLRIAKILKDNKLGGSIPWASAFYFKHPPVPVKSDYEALKMLYRGLEELGVEARPKLLEYY
jgi:myo-inositol-1-phosphate synthase